MAELEPRAEADRLHTELLNVVHAWETQRNRAEQAEAAIERVRALLEGIEQYCSDERLDVPPWIESVRAALATPTPTEETDRA